VPLLIRAQSRSRADGAAKRSPGKEFSTCVGFARREELVLWLLDNVREKSEGLRQTLDYPLRVDTRSR
jgi:hypothetical protein